MFVFITTDMSVKWKTFCCGFLCWIDHFIIISLSPEHLSARTSPGMLDTEPSPVISQFWDRCRTNVAEPDTRLYYATEMWFMDKVMLNSSMELRYTAFGTLTPSTSSIDSFKHLKYCYTDPRRGDTQTGDSLSLVHHPSLDRPCYVSSKPDDLLSRTVPRHSNLQLRSPRYIELLGPSTIVPWISVPTTPTMNELPGEGCQAGTCTF